MHLIKILCILIPFISACNANAKVETIQGPFRCPLEAVCIETETCDSGFFTTSDGHPYFCGPLDDMQSRICCFKQKPRREMSPISSQLQEAHKILYDDDGDTVLITEDHGQPPNFEEEIDLNDTIHPLEPLHEGPDLLLDLPRDGVDESEGPFQAPLDSAQYSSEMDNADRETDGNPTLTLRILEPNSNEINHALYTSRSNNYEDPRLQYNVLNPQPQHYNQPAWGNPNQPPRRDPRQSYYQTGNDCRCEKGEKGDRGPQGEPGKIVYVPVFISPSSIQYGQPNFVPPGSSKPYQQLPNSEHQYPYQQQQPFEQSYQFNYPIRSQRSPDIPAHPTPPIVPYHLPPPGPASQATSFGLSPGVFQQPPNTYHGTQHKMKSPRGH